MYLKTLNDPSLFYSNQPYGQQLAKQNVYGLATTNPAWPFTSCGLNGAPGSVACMDLHGYTAGVISLVDAWPLNIVRTWPTAGFTVSIVSSNVADAAAGTGVRAVQIDILDTSYIPHTITLVMNGQTQVNDTSYVNTCLRVNDIRCVSWGSGLANAGNLYAFDSTSAVVSGVPSVTTKIFSYMVAGDNINRCGFYTVPAGCSLQVGAMRSGFDDLVATTRQGDLTAYVGNYTAGGIIPITLPISGQLNNAVSVVSNVPQNPNIFTSRTDISLRFNCNVSSTMLAYADCVLTYN
jgi:hypothetical protein